MRHALRALVAGSVVALLLPGSPAYGADAGTVSASAAYGTTLSGEVFVKPKKPIVVVRNKAVPGVIKVATLKGVPANATGLWFLRTDATDDPNYQPSGLFLPVAKGTVQVPAAARRPTTLTVVAWTEHRSSTSAIKASDYLAELTAGLGETALNGDGLLEGGLFHNAGYLLHPVTPKQVWSGTVASDRTATIAVAGKSGVPKLGTGSPTYFALVERTSVSGVETVAATVDDRGRVEVRAQRGHDTFRVVAYATYDLVNLPRAMHVYTAVIDNFGGGMDWTKLGQHVTDEQLYQGRAKAVDLWKSQLGDWLTSTSVKQPRHYTSKLLAGQQKCRIAPGSNPPAGYLSLEKVVVEAERLFPKVDFSLRGSNILIIDPPEPCQGPDGEYIQTGAGTQGANGIRQNVIMMGFPQEVTDDKVDTIASGTVHETGHLLTLEHADSGWCTAAGFECPNSLESSNWVTIMNGTVLNHAERSRFTGLIQPDEYEEIALGSGQASVTRRVTLAPLTSTTGLRSVHVVTSTQPGARAGGRVEYWIDYASPDIHWLDGSHVPDWSGNTSGLLVLRLGVSRADGLVARDNIAENLSHKAQDWHLFQVGETYANYDGRVTVHVDAVDDAGMTLTVTLTR